MQRLLYTGGNGFIGKNFIAQYQHQFKIDAPSRQEIDLYIEQQVDDFFQDKNYDCIIHGASIVTTRKSQHAPLSCLNNNLRFFSNLFKHRHTAKRFIHLGSGAEYGRPIEIRKIEEEQLHQKIPMDEYGFSKSLISKIVGAESDIQGVNLHLFGVFGPFEDYQLRFISNALVRALSGLPIIINQNVEFDYVYIDDFLKILNEFIQRPGKFSNYNITSGSPVTLVEIAEIIIGLLGNNIKINLKNSKNGYSYTGSNKRLSEFMGSTFQFTPIKDSIERLAYWYQARLESLTPEWIHDSI